MPGLTPAGSEKSTGGLMRLFTRKTNKLQPKFEMTGECCFSFQALSMFLRLVRASTQTISTRFMSCPWPVDRL